MFSSRGRQSIVSVDEPVATYLRIGDHGHERLHVGFRRARDVVRQRTGHLNLIAGDVTHGEAEQTSHGHGEPECWIEDFRVGEHGR